MRLKGSSLELPLTINSRIQRSTTISTQVQIQVHSPSNKRYQSIDSLELITLEISLSSRSNLEDQVHLLLHLSQLLLTQTLQSHKLKLLEESQMIDDSPLILNHLLTSQTSDKITTNLLTLILIRTLS